MVSGRWWRARLVARGIPRSAVRAVVGLLPELAVDVAAADEVVFVDAAVGAPAGTHQTTVVTPEADGGRWTHHLSPGALLALTQLAFGRVPPATLVTVNGAAWDAGRGLSPELEAVLPEVMSALAARWPAVGC